MLTYSLLESVTRICCLKYIWIMLDACIYIYSTTAVQLYCFMSNFSCCLKHAPSRCDSWRFA